MQRINSYLLLGIFSLVLFLPGIVSLPVIDRDEAHFAQASRQMVQTGNYFQIRFQDITRFQKPPGINWLQAASVRLFSDGDLSVIWPYRIPSLLGALFSVLLLFYFSRRFVSEQAALLAAAFLASSLLLVVEAHMAVTDASLLSSVVLMQGALWVIYHAGVEKKHPHWGWALLFWVAMAYGLVLKGVTPLVGVLSVCTLCIIDRHRAWLRGLHIYRGLLLFVLLSLAWLLQVDAAENSNYLLQMIKKDLLPKLQGGHESHGRPPFFHLLSLPITFWPVSMFLWQGVVYAYRERHHHVVRYLLAWIVPIWIFFEIMPTKLPQYVLPTFPAIALVCALAIVDSVKKEKPNQWLRLLQVLWGVLSIGLALALSLLPYLLMNEVTLFSVMLFVVLTLMSIFTVYFACKQDYVRTRVVVLWMALLAYPLIFGGLLPELKPLWLSSKVAELVPKKDRSEQAPLLTMGYSEPSLVFSFDTKQVLYTNKGQAVSMMRENPGILLLLEYPAYSQMEHDVGCLDIIAHIKGFNYSAGRWVHLVLVKQQGRKTKENRCDTI